VYSTGGVELNITMKITLAGGLTVTVPSHELVRPLRGLDSQGVPVLNSTLSEVAVYGDAAPENSPVLGKSYLSQVRA
jgi:hypothetical protein